MSALGSETFEKAPTQLKSWGRRVESAIGAHLLSYQKDDMKLFYWNESNAEVDFVLQWNDQYIGLEVKIAKDKVSGLARFSQQFKPHKIYQLNEDGLSWQRLLEMDPRALF